MFLSVFSAYLNIFVAQMYIIMSIFYDGILIQKI